MNRIMVYPGAIPLETDLLYTNKNTMIAIAKVCSALLGTNTIANGFSTGATSPASLGVLVQPGEIYSLVNIDQLQYSSLAADTSHQILKQGVMLDAVTLNCPAPTTSGQSINYLVEASFVEADANPVVLPYYNATNPSQAFSGPANTGAAQNTQRNGTVALQVKTGASAATGSQVTPSPDAGYVGLYVVTVGYGQTTITSANISVYGAAPLLPAGIVPAVQTNQFTYGLDTGSANTYKVNYLPSFTSLVDGMVLNFEVKTTNNGPSTFSPCGISSAPIIGAGHAALQGNEMFAGGKAELMWKASASSWVLMACTGGAQQVGAATASGHAMQLGQATGRLLNIQTFATAGTFTYTPTAGTTSIEVELVGGGGGSGGTPATGAGQGACTGGGGSGAYARTRITSGFSGATITVGAAGAAGSAGGNGGSGGTSSFGAFVSAPGGSGSGFGTASSGSQVSGGGIGGAMATGGTIINSKGNFGPIGIVIGGGPCPTGIGAISPLGAGGLPAGSTGPGGAAGGPGAGGGGAYAIASQSAQAGGAGGTGIVIVREYA